MVLAVIVSTAVVSVVVVVGASIVVSHKGTRTSVDKLEEVRGS